MKVHVYGDKLDLADDLREDFVKQAKDAVGDAADIQLREVKSLLLRRVGRPSEPGDPPAYRSGELLRSFKRVAARVRGNVASAGWRSRHPGANRLEFGDTDSRGVRTLPRPYARPAIEATKGAVERLLRDRLS